MGSSEGAKKGWTEESRRKRSEAMKRRWADPEYRARLSEADKASRTPESNAKRSATQKKLWENPEFRAQHAETEAKPEVKARRSAAAKALHADPEFKERHRESLRRSWEENPGSRQKSLDALLAKVPITAAEVTVLQALTARGLACTVHKRLGRYEADVYVESLKLDVEADQHWHTAPSRKAHDAKRDAILAAQKITVIRLTEEEITAGDWSRLDAAITACRENNV
jgi:very-short-patch-repair endonuclease